MDVNMKRAEDVLMHKRLLELAKDSVQRQAFAVGAVQLVGIVMDRAITADGAPMAAACPHPIGSPP